MHADPQVWPQLSLVLRSSSGITGPDSTMLTSSSKSRSGSSPVSVAVAFGVALAVAVDIARSPSFPLGCVVLGAWTWDVLHQGQEIVTFVCRFSMTRPCGI